MEIILEKDIENLGFQYDIVKVKPGYARNFLIPKGFARLATPGSKKGLEELLKQKARKEEKELADAQKKSEQLATIPMKIGVKASNDGKLFGSVTSGHLSDKLKSKGFDIDKKYIMLPGNTIKKVGKYQAKVRLHRKHIVDFSFEIAREDDGKESDVSSKK